MNQNNWERVFTATKGLQSEACVSNFVPSADIELYRNWAMDVLADFASRGQQHLGLKVFLNRERSLDAEQLLMKHPPKPGEDPEQWANDLYDGQRFGVILNNLEKYSSDFSAKMAEAVEPLLLSQGLPLGGLATLFFMGNYGFTPFGIHKDNPGEDGFLIHMGPGKKTFFTWEAEDYLNLSGGSTTHPMTDELRKKARVYEMNPGDVFFLPSETYHVAETPEFSISIVLDFVKPSSAAFKKTLLEEMLKSIQLPATSELMAPVAWQVSKLQPEVSLDSELAESYGNCYLRLKSNGGFKEPNLSARHSVNIMSEAFKVAHPFKVQWQLNTVGQMVLFVRGYSNTFDFNEQIADFISQLNSGKVFTYEIVMQEMSGLPLQDLFQLLGFIGNHGGLMKA